MAFAAEKRASARVLPKGIRRYDRYLEVPQKMYVRPILPHQVFPEKAMRSTQRGGTFF